MHVKDGEELDHCERWHSDKAVWTWDVIGQAEQCDAVQASSLPGHTDRLSAPFELDTSLHVALTIFT